MTWQFLLSCWCEGSPVLWWLATSSTTVIIKIVPHYQSQVTLSVFFHTSRQGRREQSGGCSVCLSLCVLCVLSVCLFLSVLCPFYVFLSLCFLSVCWCPASLSVSLLLVSCLSVYVSVCPVCLSVWWNQSIICIELCIDWARWWRSRWWNRRQSWSPSVSLTCAGLIITNNINIINSINSFIMALRPALGRQDKRLITSLITAQH